MTLHYLNNYVSKHRWLGNLANERVKNPQDYDRRKNIEKKKDERQERPRSLWVAGYISIDESLIKVGRDLGCSQKTFCQSACFAREVHGGLILFQL
jgi:hypothetical protein